MVKKETPKSYNRNILEIRYKPNSKVLDYRGKWAEQISSHMKLSEWRIGKDRIDIYDKEGKDRAFISYRNAGFVTNDAPTANYFPDKAIKLFKFIFELHDFDSPLYVLRIGVRVKFYTGFNGNFEELMEKYANRFLKLTDDAKKILNAELLDIGSPLNFKDKYGHFNMMGGPMRSEQAQEYLERDEELSKVGLYFDIDYWIQPENIVKNERILDTISVFSEQAWGKHKGVCNIILKD